LGERRVTVSREGTTAYLKAAYHAPAATDEHFFPLLLLDAVLTGAKGVNLWTSFRNPPPQRSARLYRKLVDGGLASAVQGGVVPTQEPFLYTISITATEGTPLSEVEGMLLTEVDRIRREGITTAELEKAKHQLRARMVFEGDSISNIAHQLGYFETIASWRLYPEVGSRITAVTLEQVGDAATTFLAPNRRTIGWFQPTPGEMATGDAE
jgi:zinc protease